MKVTVVGANGQIGKQLVHFLKEEDGYTPIAMVRKEEQADSFAEDGIESVLADLEGSVDALVKAFSGSDAVVFSAGSGGSTGLDKTLLIDLDGAAKTVEAAEKAGISRYVMVSAFQADNRENWNDELRPYYVAKHYADKVLMASGLDYTIVRPGGLLNESGTGKVKIGDKVEPGSIAREDVARVLLEVLGAKNTYGAAFDVVDGEDSIEHAVSKI
ncbi:SDR family oxidoreductase [Sutcliffiella horikoshii]|uniref:SDR family oxidoreductase n=1 Tax=Sutcliffiella horikoshii TaxID=79883 RepID=UPI001F289FA8|nr:SDR family oxidoreductase [Sutcliffiella horikoshii]MCG1020407.1 SDR family oxidoreductase [Sutcliffiella horikoshii]